MIDKKEMLKKMLDNLINDKPEDAQVNFHAYLGSKMKQEVHDEDISSETPEKKDD